MAGAGRVDGYGRVPLCLRLGVTGHRAIEDEAGVAQAVSQFIEAVVREVAIDDVRPWFEVIAVSPLAEGADRIVARAVLDRSDGALEVVLPLEVADYEQDFANDASKAEFRALLARSRNDPFVIGHATRPDAYLGVGKEIVDRCDVLIAIWDGRPARGRGGTAEIVEYARSKQVPITIIDPTGADATPAELPRIEDRSLTPEAVAELAAYDAIEVKPAPGPTTTGAHDGAWVEPYYRRADAIALHFQTRYWRVARWLWTLAPVAVMIAAGQVIWGQDHVWLVLIEVGVLAVIILLVGYARLTDVHERWISSRFLSERFRSASYMAAVDVSWSGGGREPDEPTADAWIRRAFTEIWVRRPHFAVTDADVGSLKPMLTDRWISKQIEYHAARSARTKTLHKQLGAIALVLFSVALGAAVAHFFADSLFGDRARSFGKAFAFVSITAPACGAALHGYSVQRDYRRHSERSARMATDLERRRTDVLAARDLSTLQSAVIEVDRLMREECADWFGAVRLHDIEMPA